LCPNSKSDLKDQKASDKCAYLIGDDTCSAVKEEGASSLRIESCQNEVKERCCYTCNFVRTCDIRCDLLDSRKGDEQENSSNTSTEEKEVPPEAICGDCIFYLESKCPRGYINDLDLWRQQKGCWKFGPNKIKKKR